MPPLDPDALLALLRDPNAESRQIAELVGVSREDAGRAARLVLSMARARAEEVAALPPPLALAALRAAAPAGRADVVAALAASASRDVSKEAKRTLHLMRARGVEVPELRRQASAPPPPPPDPELPCFASALDGQGERAVWLARNVPGKGIELCQAIASDTQGLLSLQVGVLGRKEFRAFAQDLVDRGGQLGVAEVTRHRAHALLGEARRLTESAGKPLPEGATAWLARLGEAPPLPDPALDFPSLPETEEREALAAGARLHERPLLRGWLADEAALRALAARLDEIAASALLVDERQRAEQSAGAVEDALAGYFDPARRTLWSRRLFAAASHLADAGDSEGARLAGAAARALASGRDAREVPFARLLFEKALAPASGAPAPAAEALR
ncbi:MAG TPA: hypothetical protein VH880_10145 [Anaeromyxobacteraceae bacterium]